MWLLPSKSDSVFVLFERLLGLITWHDVWMNYCANSTSLIKYAWPIYWILSHTSFHDKSPNATNDTVRKGLMHLKKHFRNTPQNVFLLQLAYYSILCRWVFYGLRETFSMFTVGLHLWAEWMNIRNWNNQ